MKKVRFLLIAALFLMTGSLCLFTQNVLAATDNPYPGTPKIYRPGNGTTVVTCIGKTQNCYYVDEDGNEVDPIITAGGTVGGTSVSVKGNFRVTVDPDGARVVFRAVGYTRIATANGSITTFILPKQ